jgi:hypothetical protein
MKDVVLLAVSFYLLKQDAIRVSLAAARPVSDRLEELAPQRAQRGCMNRLNLIWRSVKMIEK